MTLFHEFLVKLRSQYAVTETILCGGHSITVTKVLVLTPCLPLSQIEPPEYPGWSAS
jgi:hypothetical protein